MTYDWFEVWADTSPEIPYVLLLLYDPERPDCMVVVDPKEGDKVIFTAPTYEETINWLLEDEYTMVRGRCVE